MYYTTHSPQHTTTVFSNDFQGYEVMENTFLLRELHAWMHSIALSLSSFIRFKVFLMQSEHFKSFANALNVFSESSIHYPGHPRSGEFTPRDARRPSRKIFF